MGNLLFQIEHVFIRNQSICRWVSIICDQYANQVQELPFSSVSKRRNVDSTSGDEWPADDRPLAGDSVIIANLKCTSARLYLCGGVSELCPLPRFVAG